VATNGENRVDSIVIDIGGGGYTDESGYICAETV
jgi:hypothetical protein